MTIKPTMPSAWPGLTPDTVSDDVLAEYLGPPRIIGEPRAIHLTGNAAPYQYPPEAYRNVYAEPVRPRQRAQLLDPKWGYTPSDQTDVRATWARFGWKPTQR